MLLTLQPLNGSKSNGEQSLLAKGVRLTAHLTLSHPPLTFPQSTRETIGTRKKEKRKSLYDDSKRSPCLSSKEDPPRSESREGATPQRRRCNLHSGELSTASVHLSPCLLTSLSSHRHSVLGEVNLLVKNYSISVWLGAPPSSSNAVGGFISQRMSFANEEFNELLRFKFSAAFEAISRDDRCSNS
jgi:hypothetical protein